MPSWGLSKCIETKLQTTCFTSFKEFLKNKKRSGALIYSNGNNFWRSEWIAEKLMCSLIFVVMCFLSIFHPAPHIWMRWLIHLSTKLTKFKFHNERKAWNKWFIFYEHPSGFYALFIFHFFRLGRKTRQWKASIWKNKLWNKVMIKHFFFN